MNNSLGRLNDSAEGRRHCENRDRLRRSGFLNRKVGWLGPLYEAQRAKKTCLGSSLRPGLSALCDG